MTGIQILTEKYLNLFEMHLFFAHLHLPFALLFFVALERCFIALFLKSIVLYIVQKGWRWRWQWRCWQQTQTLPVW